jgi:hypothetical protein
MHVIVDSSAAGETRHVTPVSRCVLDWLVQVVSWHCIAETRHNTMPRCCCVRRTARRLLVMSCCVSLQYSRATSAQATLFTW